MKIPSVNTSPVTQAYQNRKAAIRNSAVARDISYNRESLALQGKGLDLKLKEIKHQDAMYRWGVAKQVAGAVSMLAGAIQGSQTQKANAFLKTAAQQMQTTGAEGIASGEMYVQFDDAGVKRNAGEVATTASVQGTAKLDSLKSQQIEYIKNQHWMKSVEDQAIESLNSAYYGYGESLKQDFYLQATKDRNTLEAINLKTAISSDIANTTGTDYNNLNNFLASLKGRSPDYIAGLGITGMREIDMGRDSAQVASIAKAGGKLAGDKAVSDIVAKRGYDTKTEGQLQDISDASVKSAILSASAEGTKFMTDVINTNAGNPAMGSAIQQARAEAEGMKENMSPEAWEAFKSGIDKVQLAYNTETFLRLTKGDNPDLMTPLQLEEKIDQIDAMEDEFDGSSASRKVWENMRSIYSSELKAKREDEAYSGFDAQLDNVSTKEDLEKINLDEIRNNKDLSKRDKRSLESKYKAISKSLDSATIAGSKQAQKDYIDMQNALINSIPNAILNGDITVEEGKILIRTYMTNTKREAEAGNLNFAFDEAIKVNTTGLKVIDELEDKIKTKYKDQFDVLKTTITTDLNALWGIKDKKQYTEEQLNLLNESITWATGDLMSVLCNSPNMSDADVLKEINRISNTYTAEKYEILSKPVEVGIGDNQYETAMDVTAKYQDHPDIVYLNNDKELAVNPLYKTEYDDAQKNQVEMLRNNYGVPAKDVYTIIRYKDKIVPQYVDSNGQRYVVMDNQVFKRFENTLEPIEPTKAFGSEGYAPIQGLDRKHIGDANSGYKASGNISSDYYQRFFR